MGLLDGPLRAAAATVVGTLGASVVVRLRSYGEFNVTTRTSADGYVDIVGKGVFANRAMMGKKESVVEGVGGSSSKTRFLLLAASDWAVKPTMEHLIFAEGVEFTIIDIETTRGSDEEVIYELELRGPQTA